MEKKIQFALCKAVPTEQDVYFDMALTMLEEIAARNARGEKTVMIVPVGPTAQYPMLAEMAAQAAARGKKVELITNGTLLSRSRITTLLEAGISRIWVSI